MLKWYEVCILREEIHNNHYNGAPMGREQPSTKSIESSVQISSSINRGYSNVDGLMQSALNHWKVLQFFIYVLIVTFIYGQ